MRRQRNPTGNLLSITHPTTAAGTAVDTFAYNVYGQVLTYTSADGTKYRYTYDDAHTGGDVGIGDPEYVGTGYVTKVVKDSGTGSHLNATTQFTYDSYGHVATVQDPNGNTTTLSTNARDQVMEVDGASGEVSQVSHDAMGHVIASQKKLGTDWQKYSATYNSYEQCTSVRQFNGSSGYRNTSYAYDLNGNCTSVTDPLSHVTTLAYDERNLPYLKTDALSKMTRTDFDANGTLPS